MWFSPPNPVFAIGMDNLLTVVLVVIMILGWLINFVNSQQKPPAAGGRPRPPRPRDTRLSDEIDNFLQEVTGSGRKKPKETPLELVFDEEPQRRSPPRVRKRPDQAGRTRQRQTPQPKRTQPDSSTVERRPARDSNRLESSIPAHQVDSMENRIAHQVEDYLSHDVNESVAKHLGSFSGGDAARSTATSSGRASPARARRIVGLLRDPVGIRQAIVINEVLSRPKALR
jgi:hypothetical protein